MTQMYQDASKRHDFIFLVDVTNGNPNGDPDAGNAPRTDPETMTGLITDVCIKRKIRDYVDLLRGTEPGYRIYIQNSGIALNSRHKEAHDTVFQQQEQEEEPEEKKGNKKAGINERATERQEARRKYMCEQYYDIRTFGAVMSTGDFPAGQVRGPIQIVFAQSVDPISPQDISITRCAVADIDPTKGTTTTMGRKQLVMYGLYIVRGFFAPAYAVKTGFTNEDLTLFWQALEGVWDLDHSAARGMMSIQGLYIFTHENSLGNAHAHTLFDRVRIRLKKPGTPPRHISDYHVSIDEEGLPAGVTLTRLVDVQQPGLMPTIMA